MKYIKIIPVFLSVILGNSPSNQSSQISVAYCNMSEVVIPNSNFKACRTNELVSDNESVQVQCWRGFRLEDTNNDQITCKNGIWQDPKPSCVPSTCQPPGEKQHSKLISHKLHYEIGDEVVYICDRGYFDWKNYASYLLVKCQEDGTWSDVDSYCVNEKFTTTTIVINESKSPVIILDCDGVGYDNLTWFHNSKKIKESEYVSAGSYGNLYIDTTGYKSEGDYFCQEFINNTINFGLKFYRLVTEVELKLTGESGKIKNLEHDEDENVILKCPSEATWVKWHKDGTEIDVYNKYKNRLPNNWLYLKNAKLTDGGIYKCEATFKVGPTNYEKFNTTYKLTINAPLRSTCGRLISSDTSSRHPWLVLLQREDGSKPFCYGTILNENWGITSAVCLSNLQLKNQTNYITLRPNGGYNRYPVESIKLHPSYQSQRYGNNVGLFKLEKPVKFGKNLLPVCLDKVELGKKEDCDVNDFKINGTVIGWGSLSVDDSHHMRLGTENMSFVSKLKCRKFFGFAPDMFCAENLDGSITLVGDRGSPFLIDYDDRKYLMGIFNWGERISRTGNYDYFTNVLHHYEWIKEIIED